LTRTYIQHLPIPLIAYIANTQAPIWVSFNPWKSSIISKWTPIEFNKSWSNHSLFRARRPRGLKASPPHSLGDPALKILDEVQESNSVNSLADCYDIENMRSVQSLFKEPWKSLINITKSYLLIAPYFWLAR
jgi:hypothetical protein